MAKRRITPASTADGQHQPEICKCEDYDGLEEISCTCSCERCRNFRLRVWREKRVMDLRYRLEKAGIDVADFADLLWPEFEQYIEVRVHQLVTAAMTRKLKNLRLVSDVQWSSIERE